jgi:hypothetical protein
MPTAALSCWVSRKATAKASSSGLSFLPRSKSHWGQAVDLTPTPCARGCSAPARRGATIAGRASAIPRVYRPLRLVIQ